MTGDVHDVVDAAEDPECAVVVVLGAVTGEVPAFFGVAGPVGVAVAVHVAPDAAEHRRPRLVEDEVAVAAGAEGLGVVVDDLRGDTGQWGHRGSGFGGGDTGEWGDHDRAGLGLPPGVDDGGFVAADDLSEPAPRFGVDGLAHRSEEADRGQVVGVGDLAAPLHERPHEGGGGVVDGDAVLLDDVEVAVLVRGVGGAFVDDLGDAVREGSVDDVGVSGDPADVGGAPVDVLSRFVIEDVVVGVRGLGEVAAGGVDDALGLSGGAGGVENEQGMFGVEGLRLVLG